MIEHNTEKNIQRKKSIYKLDKLVFIFATIFSFVTLGFLLINMGVLSGNINDSDAIYKVYNLANIYKIIYYLAFVNWLLLIATFAYTCYIRINKSINIKTRDNFFLVLALISWLIAFFTSRVYLKFLDGAKKMLGGGSEGFSFSGLFSNGFEVDRLVSQMTTFRELSNYLFLILALISLIISAYLYYKKLYLGKSPKSMDNELDMIANKVKKSSLDAKEKLVNAKNKLDDSIKDATNYDAYEDYDTEIINNMNIGKRASNFDDYDDYHTYADNEPREFNKKLLLIPGLILILIVGFFGYKLISEKLKPDALISTSNVDININYEGYDGYATAYAEIFEYPRIEEIKDESQREKITRILSNPEIKLSKEEKIKNGDEITATLSYPDMGDLKLKFDNDKLIKTVKVENLDTLINSIKDIPQEAIDRMDKVAKKSIKDYIYGSDLKVTKVRVYEEKISDADLANQTSGANYSITNVYSAHYYYDGWDSGYRNELFAYTFYNIKSQNGGVIFDSSRSYTDLDMEELNNRLKFDGYTEITELRNSSNSNDTSKEEKNEEVNEKNESKDVGLSPMENLANSLVGQTKYVKDRGNLRSGPGVNTSTVIELQDGAEVYIKKAQAEGDTRVWCYVDAVDVDGLSYTGWISNRVLY